MLLISQTMATWCETPYRAVCQQTAGIKGRVAAESGVLRKKGEPEAREKCECKGSDRKSLRAAREQEPVYTTSEEGGYTCFTATIPG